MAPLLLVILSAALVTQAGEPVYEFPEVDPVEGVLVRPSASFVLGSPAVDARPCPDGEQALMRRRGALERRSVTAARLAALGDLDGCEARLLELDLMRRWDQALILGTPPGDFEAIEREVEDLRRSALDHYAAALDLPGGRDRDQVLLARAQEALLLEDDTVAQQSLEALVRDHPDSRYRVWAWFQLGELAFEMMEPGTAQGWYQQVEAAEHELSAYAAYKLAWCLVMMGQEVEGVGRLLHIAEGSDDDPIADAARSDLEQLGTVSP